MQTAPWGLRARAGRAGAVAPRGKRPVVGPQLEFRRVEAGSRGAGGGQKRAKDMGLLGATGRSRLDSRRPNKGRTGAWHSGSSVHPKRNSGLQLTGRAWAVGNGSFLRGEDTGQR